MIPHIVHHKAKTGELAFFLFLLGCGLLLWNTIDAVLLFFAAALFGTFLSRVAGLLQNAIPALPHTAAVLLALLGFTLIFAVFAVFIMPGLYEQAGILVEELPKAIDQLELWVRNQSWLLNTAEDAQWSSAAGKIASKAGTVTAALFGGVVGLGIVFVLGVFFALKPEAYKKGIMLLLPKNQHKRVKRIFEKSSETLWLWLLGRGVSMLAVAVLTTVGLMILGMPLALTFGLLAGLLSFIPNFGPILSVIPATLLGIREDPANLYLVPSLYAIVQIIEGNFITPFVEHKMVHVPPGVVIMAQVICAMLFGTLGLLMATPLAVTTFIVVQEFYVHNVLGKKTSVL